jgi:type I restriction enzyme S subunit
MNHQLFNACSSLSPGGEIKTQRRVEGLFALADQLEERLAKARGQVDQLTPSLLARAFAGQLVPQDANDEPASALLRKIKSRQSPADSDDRDEKLKR